MARVEVVQLAEKDRFGSGVATVIVSLGGRVYRVEFGEPIDGGGLQELTVNETTNGIVCRHATVDLGRERSAPAPRVSRYRDVHSNTEEDAARWERVHEGETG